MKSFKTILNEGRLEEGAGFVVKHETKHNNIVNKMYFGKGWSGDIEKSKVFKTKKEAQKFADSLIPHSPSYAKNPPTVVKKEMSRNEKYQKKYQPLINKVRKALKKEGVNFRKYTLKGSDWELILVVGTHNPEFDEGNPGEYALNQFYGTKGWGGTVGATSGGDGYETLDWIG